MTSCQINKVVLLISLHRDLDDGQPFVRIFLIPDSVYINRTRISSNLITFLFEPGKKVYVSLIQLSILSEHLHTGCLRNLRYLLEPDDIGVLAFGGHFLAILDVNILGLVASVFDGIAVARCGTLASQAGHFRTDDFVAQAA